MTRFHGVLFDSDIRAKQVDCQTAFENVEDILVRNFDKTSRALDIALEKLEEAHMWVNKALRTVQIERDVKSLEDQG